MTSAPAALRSALGLAAVAALVVGDMLGSGIFFTHGELAGVAQHGWQVYFIWGLAGFITLCGALTLAELCSLLPRAGASTQMANILMVAAVFRLGRRLDASAYRTPGYPVTPLVYIVVLLGFLVSAIAYRPVETLIGLLLSATGVPVYFWLRRKKA